MSRGHTKQYSKSTTNNFRDMMYLFFLQCYHHKEFSSVWKHSITILRHKKNPTIITKYKPIALACTIYKVFTSMIASIFTTFKEKHKSYVTTQNDSTQ
jgi:hypothetical protein